MQTLSRIMILAAGFGAFAFGQSWEVGGAGGFGFYRNLNVTSANTTGSAGFGSGFALSGVVGNRINRWLDGEVRYTYHSDDLRVSSGSAKAEASAQSHAMHYDFLLGGKAEDVGARPFLAAGGGVKYYRGTGAEPIYQPLSNLAILTHTNEVQPMVSVGAGIKFRVSRNAILRLDFRDYVTPVPSSLLAVPPGARLSGWVHDFVLLVGVSRVY